MTLHQNSEGVSKMVMHLKKFHLLSFVCNCFCYIDNIIDIDSIYQACY